MIKRSIISQAGADYIKHTIWGQRKMPLRPKNTGTKGTAVQDNWPIRLELHKSHDRNISHVSGEQRFLRARQSSGTKKRLVLTALC